MNSPPDDAVPLNAIVFARAGHCYPILADSHGANFLKTDAGLPLGIKEVAFSEQTVKLTAGCRFVLYSDGVTEAMNPSLEQYGESRLADHVAGQSFSIESLLSDLNTFSGGAPASDDVTVVMIEAKK